MFGFSNYWKFNKKLLFNSRFSDKVTHIKNDRLYAELKQLLGNSEYRIRFPHRIKVQCWNTEFYQFFRLLNCPLNSHFANSNVIVTFFYFISKFFGQIYVKNRWQNIGL